MSRRRTKAQEIRNPENYFNKYIAMEIRKDREKDEEYYEMFVSLEDALSSSGRKSHKTLMLMAANIDDRELEKKLADTTLFGWIDYIQDSTLYRAIKALPDEDKYFLTLRYKHCLTQRDIALMLHMTQSAVCQREQALKKFFRDFFKNAYQKP